MHSIALRSARWCWRRRWHATWRHLIHRSAVSATTPAMCNTSSAIIITPTGANATSRNASASRPRRKPAPSRPKRPTVAELMRSITQRLKRAKLVCAHGTSDPVAEAAFLVGETLGIHPDHVDARAGMAVTAAQEKKIASLVE